MLFTCTKTDTTVNCFFKSHSDEIIYATIKQILCANDFDERIEQNFDIITLVEEQLLKLNVNVVPEFGY